MAAPKGNQFWKLRSKHGRDKLFESPQLMWDAACEYFEWCEQNPLMMSEAKVVSGGKGEGSTIEIIEVPKMRAMTLEGLCRYLNCNTQYFKTFKAQLTEGEKDFNTVISEIEAVMFDQKFSGAAAGFLKENLIARHLGIQDKQIVVNEGKQEIVITREILNGPNDESAKV